MLFQANVIGENIISGEKPVGSAPETLGGGLLAMYGDRDGVTIHLDADDADDAERRIVARLGSGVYIDEIVEAVPVREHPAFADVTLGLSYGEAHAIADSLELLAGIDEGENTDHDELVRLANVVRERIAKEEA